MIESECWRKSSYSGGGNGDCLEVADGYAHVPVRDSKAPEGPWLGFPAQAWALFVSSLKAESFRGQLP